MLDEQVSTYFWRCGVLRTKFSRGFDYRCTHTLPSIPRPISDEFDLHGVTAGCVSEAYIKGHGVGVNSAAGPPRYVPCANVDEAACEWVKSPRCEYMKGHECA